MLLHGFFANKSVGRICWVLDRWQQDTIIILLPLSVKWREREKESGLSQSPGFCNLSSLGALAGPAGCVGIALPQGSPVPDYCPDSFVPNLEATIKQPPASDMFPNF